MEDSIASPDYAEYLYLLFGEGDGTPLQYSCLENPTDGGAWKAAVHGVTEGRTRLSDFTFTFHFPAVEKEMATRSTVLAWRIPGTGEPGGLPSMGSHRVRHDWSDLAAATACTSTVFVWKYSWPSISSSSTPTDSTNYSKIFGKKIIGSSKKQNWSFPCASNYMHSIYIIFTTIYISFTSD